MQARLILRATARDHDPGARREEVLAMGRGATEPEVTRWNSDSFALRDRYDAWVDALHRTYGSWQVGRSVNGYSASLETKDFGGAVIANCICDPCSGKRSPLQIGTDDQETLAIQLTLDGLEHIHYRNCDYRLRAGDLIVWDNTQTMTFDVKQRLHKVSLLLPLRRLKDWLPTTWHSIPRMIASGSPNGVLLTSYILSLAQEDMNASLVKGDTIAEASMALLAGAIDAGPVSAGRTLRETQLRRIEAYIDEHLADPDLTLASIARAHRVSLRYLHWLFSSSHRTVARYILEERLARCRRDLLNPLMADRKIADVALSWGFNDPTHFSRRFKEHFGVLPSELRLMRKSE